MASGMKAGTSRVPARPPPPVKLRLLLLRQRQHIDVGPLLLALLILVQGKDASGCPVHEHAAEHIIKRDSACRAVPSAMHACLPRASTPIGCEPAHAKLLAVSTQPGCTPPACRNSSTLSCVLCAVCQPMRTPRRRPRSHHPVPPLTSPSPAGSASSSSSSIESAAGGAARAASSAAAAAAAACSSNSTSSSSGSWAGEPGGGGVGGGEWGVGGEG